MLLSISILAWADEPAASENDISAVFENLIERLKANPPYAHFYRGH